MNYKAIAFLFCVSGSLLTSACKTKEDQGGSALKGEEQVASNRCNTKAKAEEDVAGMTYGPTCQDLTANYPQIDDPENPEDLRVICPFLRILNRSRELADEISKRITGDKTGTAQLPVSIAKVATTAKKFGCDALACGFIATDVAKGQLGKKLVLPNESVDIGRLSFSKGAAHDCGFTFALGDTGVNEGVRAATLAILKSRAVNDHLTYDDLVYTKVQMCQRDFDLARAKGITSTNLVSADGTTLSPDSHDSTEVNLIYSYLGGADNGYITYTDLDLLFHARIPANKSKFVLGKALLDHVTKIGEEKWKSL